MKKALLFISVFLVVGYIVFAILQFSSRSSEEICNEVYIQVTDSTVVQFISANDIRAFLERGQMLPVGEKIANINTEEIEKKLEAVPVIETAEAYFSPKGSLYINITQRKPIVRVMTSSSDYFVDESAQIIPVGSNFNVYLPIATGNVDTIYSQTALYDFAMFLKKHEFWNAQIEQIDVLTNKDVVLIPRVGEHQVILGQIEGHEQKLNQLMEFYKNGLNEAGWNKYDKINLKFEGQIVCTKK